MRANPTLINTIWTAVLISALCMAVYLRHVDARPANLTEVAHHHGG